MATMKVCDRCWAPIAPDEGVGAVTVNVGGPQPTDEFKVEQAEVCADCLKVVIGYLKRMKLGPTAVKGGVRKGKKPKQTVMPVAKPKSKLAEKEK